MFDKFINLDLREWPLVNAAVMLSMSSNERNILFNQMPDNERPHLVLAL